MQPNVVQPKREMTQLRDVILSNDILSDIACVTLIRK